MTEFEKILSEQNPKAKQAEPKATEHPKTEAASEAEMRERRERCYSMISDACMEITADADHFMKFLGVLSRFERYSLNNNILIYAQKPSALRLKDRWKVVAEKQGIRENAKPLMILEPQKFTGNGGEWTRYNAVDKYDVADLEKEVLSIETALDLQMKIRALIHKCPVEIKTLPVSEYPADRTCGAFYDVEHNRIVAKADMGYEEIFLSVAEAMAHVEMKRGVEGAYNPAEYAFEAKCIAYTLATRYGVSVDPIAPSQKYHDLNEEDTKASLAMIHKGVKGINYRMTLKLEPPKEKEQNREDGEAR